MKFTRGDIICREDLGYPEGALVCDGYDDAGRLLVHPLGSGLQLIAPAHEERRFRVVAEEEKSANLFRRGRFVLSETEEAFDGWSNGRLWNGWEMPRFEFAVCQVVLEFLGAEQGRFEKEGAAFMTVGNDEEERWPAEEITISDGSSIKVYPLGAGSWIWEEEA